MQGILDGSWMTDFNKLMFYTEADTTSMYLTFFFT
jgi:hypothetical protein